MDKHPKRPRDPSQIAKLMVDIASGEVFEMPPLNGKPPAAVERSRAGGLKSGKTQAEKLKPETLHHHATKAARARWKKIWGLRRHSLSWA